MKGFKRRVIGTALAVTMLFGCGQALALENEDTAEIPALMPQGETQHDFEVTVTKRHNGQHTSTTFYFTPAYPGTYSFETGFEDRHGGPDDRLHPSFRVGHSGYSTEVEGGHAVLTRELETGRSYAITATAEHTGSYTIHVQFIPNDPQPSFYEEVEVSSDYNHWTHERTYSVEDYQFVPEDNGNYEITASDAWRVHDGDDPLIPYVEIFRGTELITYLEGEGTVVAGLEADTAYLVRATANHSGGYTLTITLLEEEEAEEAEEEEIVIVYTEEQLIAMSTNNFVGTLYTRILGRAADADGLTAFANDLLYQGYSASEVVRMFFSSEEFAGLNMDNETFVATVYSVFCDREATEDEAADMMDQLESGVTRLEIVDQMAATEEWADVCAFYRVNV